jgi:signal peptidase II
VVSIVLIRLILQCRRRGEAIAYSLILGGAVGNLIDRIFRGYVVDSFDVYWQSWHWPAFNLADIAIVLGTVLFLYVSFIPEKSGTNAAPDGSG